MDVLINFIIAVVSALITWGISHLYYKKSLRDQAGHWLKIESALLAQINDDTKNDKLILHEKRMQAAIQDYTRKGTPKYFINTCEDLSLEEKVKMFDDVLLRARGSKGKNNPYKLN
jgi:hypothetical protein